MSFSRVLRPSAVLLTASLLLAACADEPVVETPQATARALEDDAPTPTPEPSPTPTPTPTPAPSPTPAVSESPTSAPSGAFTQEAALDAAERRRAERGECDDSGFADGLDRVVTQTEDAMLVFVACFVGAYQANGEVLVYTDGELEVVAVEQWIAGELGESNEVVGEVDEGVEGQVTNLQRYRGLGDCGLFQTWSWSGGALTLLEAREQECSDDSEFKPVDEWPLVYER